MQVHRLCALSDNYIFLLHDATTQQAVVVDPAEAEPVLDCLESLGAELIAIFNTHHHGDHVGGNRDLLRAFPSAVVYGGAQDRGRIPGQQVFLEEGDHVALWGQSAVILFVPGHTRAHIAYYFPPDSSPDSIANAEPMGDLFCGDTLFAGGCGRLFEGSPAQMVASLSKLRSLPGSTQIWCAHEYTLKNLQFAQMVDPQNAALQKRMAEVIAARHQGQPTIPSVLAVEQQTNPFLRWDQPEIQAAIGHDDPVQTFARLRGMKDLF